MKNHKTISVFSLILLSPIFFCFTAHADTEVGREINVDTTWTLVGSPYIVTSNIQVVAGVTLTIEPGVTVKFNKNLGMLVDGKLVARGTQANMITFTTNVPNPSINYENGANSGCWSQIKLSQTSPVATFDSSDNYTDGSIFEYCIAEWGGSLWSDVFLADFTSPFVNFCTIQNCVVGGVNIINGNLADRPYKHPDLKITRITNNTIKDSLVGGISMQGDSCFAFNNSISEVSNGIYAIGMNHTITGNTIKNLGLYGGSSGSGHGIIVSSYSAYSDTLTNYEINYNTISDFAVGVAIFAGGLIGSLNIFGNIINNITTATEQAPVVIYCGENICPQNVYIGYNTFSNTKNISPAGGYAGAIYGYGTIEHNCFDNNTCGVDGANILYVTANSKINYNNFESSASGYDIYNTVPFAIDPDLDAKNNYWGTTDESVIQSKIFDFYTNMYYSKVLYAPFLTASASCDPSTSPTTTTTTIATTTTSTVVLTTTSIISSTTTSTVLITTTSIISSTTTTTPGGATTTSVSSGNTTTTMIVPGASTTTTTGICPAKKALGENNPNLENLRDFRDSKLAHSAVGRRIINIYYNNADSINAALERSPALRAVTRKVLEVVAPMVGRKE
jgi:hypothetical protein